MIVHEYAEDEYCTYCRSELQTLDNFEKLCCIYCENRTERPIYCRYCCDLLDEEIADFENAKCSPFKVCGMSKEDILWRLTLEKTECR